MKNLVVTGLLPERNRYLPELLRKEGYVVTNARGGEETLRLVKEGPPDLILIGTPPEISPANFIHSLAGRFPESRTILVLAEPMDTLLEGSRILDMSGMSDSEIAGVLPGLDILEQTDGGVTLVGQSGAMEQVRQMVDHVAPTSMTVLITGESGTGKDVVARLLHEKSDRVNKPFIAVNCAALPEGVLESELFGHEKGAFTGAAARRQGRFELADRGTLFLDEIGDMPIQTQAKLLRVLEEKRFLRVGGVKHVSVNVRLIAATNAQLEDAVERGTFRKDLFYRLNVIHIPLPPLRERREDVPPLINYFIGRAASEHRLPKARLSPDAMETLRAYHWPGNVRELRNMVEKLVILERGGIIGEERVARLLGERFSSTGNLPVPISATSDRAEKELIYQSLLAIRAELAELRQLISGNDVARRGPITAESSHRYQADAEVLEVPEEEPPPIRTAADFEQEAIRKALEETGGNRRLAAEILGIGERTLYRKIKRYNLG